jgi:hypothetical protein
MKSIVDSAPMQGQRRGDAGGIVAYIVFGIFGHSAKAKLLVKSGLGWGIDKHSNPESACICAQEWD